MPCAILTSNVWSLRGSQVGSIARRRSRQHPHPDSDPREPPRPTDNPTTDPPASPSPTAFDRDGSYCHVNRWGQIIPSRWGHF